MKKAINFSSKQKELNYIKAIHSIPSKTQPSKSVAAASPGNTPLRVRGKTVKVNHKKGK